MQEVISRAEAIRKNLSRYFTGKPCKNGHTAARRVSDYSCTECSQEASARYLSRNTEKHRERTREWRKANPEAWAEIKRRADLKMLYGLSTKEFKAMLEQQGNACAICQEPFKSTPHVDHCHTTGKVRGLLCGSCNTGIGLLGDDPLRLERAVAYLKDNL